MATKLYLHNYTIEITTLPAAEQSTLASANDFEANQALNRLMDTTIGKLQASLANTSTATSSLTNYYVARWVSPVLDVTSIAANTWDYNFAAAESNSSANFPCDGTTNIYVNFYVWRLSTNSKVGTILDGNTVADFAEPSATNTEKVMNGTFSGGSVAGITAGDCVLVFEMWFRVDQLLASAYTQTVYFDGTTENTTDNATVSNHAAFIQTPEDIKFLGYMPCDGSSYISIPDASLYNLTQFSIEVSFRTTNPSDVEMEIVCKGGIGSDSVGQNDNYSIRMASSSTLRGGFEESAGTDHYAGGSDPGGPYDNDIQHKAVVTYDQSNVRLYIDGLEVDTHATSVSPANVTHPLVIGRNSRASDRFFVGIIDEVRIWSNDLTAGEVLASFEKGTVPQTGAIIAELVFGFTGNITATPTSKTVTNKFITHG